ncbi:acyl-CoA dehydrogenase family protein [Nocardioides sp. GXZ039]|uniref:acyl-CoA dehydrogenase family protein n=1 Tax=Nocardioides sp. GXZ039 TaxID=3136018 RepID=UPI0030F36F2F
MATDAPPLTAQTDQTGQTGPPTPAGPPDRVDVEALTTLLDGPHGDLRRAVRERIAEHASILVYREELPTPEFRERVLQLVRTLAETGQTSLGFPVAYGGAGDVGASVAAFETLALGDLSVLVKVGVQFGLFGGAVLQLGTQRHHDRYLARIASGELLGCFAMTETGHGSNVAALETVATYDPDTDEFVITTPREEAGKDYIGNAAAHGELAVVFAQLVVASQAHGVHALLVPIRVDGEPAPGVRIEDDGHKMGLNGVDNGRLWFTDVRVPREVLLDRFAQVSAEGEYRSPIENPNKRFFTMLGTLIQGRVSVSGASLSASKVALAIAVRYALQRRQFGADGSDAGEELLLDYGLHQRRLLPLLARTYALHFAQEELVAQLHDSFTEPAGDGGGDVDAERQAARRRLESRAAGTNALATWHATRTIQESREACGGAGYLAVNRFAALKADPDVFTTFEGDNHVLLQLVAKGLLTDYAQAFGDMDRIELVRYVASLGVETTIERAGVHTWLERIKDVLPGGDDWDQEAGLLDSDYQRAMYRYREEHTLAAAARRLKRGIDGGLAAGEVFSRVQPHLIAAARAHLERQVLEVFVERVRATPDGDVKVALGLLCDLHALSGIEADRAWFLEHGRLSSQRSKAITREVDSLNRQLRPLAGDLVDAFAIPPELLRAPALLAPASP